jgi:Na+/H+ antiporter NhaC
MSIVIYAGAGVLILGLRRTNMRADLPYAFYAAAAILAIGSIVIRRAQLHRMKLEVVTARRGVEGLIKHLLNATILAAGIAEIIGVLALLVAFFGGDRSDVIRLGVVALAVSLYNYPRRSAWQQAVDYFSATNAAAGQSSLGL